MMKHISRRDFALLGGAVLSGRPSRAQDGGLTARQVVERIQKTLAAAGVAWRTQTVDTFKAGNPDTAVQGIATTFMATLDSLQRAAAAGKNFVITHEPTFWNHLDKTGEFSADPIFKFKMAFVERHKMVVWRFHDHWHARKPDAIYVGFNRRMGWDKHLSGESLGVYRLPETTLEALARDVERKLKTRSLRIIGAPELEVSTVAIGQHSLSGNASALQKSDVVIVPEAREWDSAEYLRDLVDAGLKKGALIVAHEEFEEWGMEDCATWLATFIHEAPVEWIPAGEPFWIPGHKS
jgi:putative NIF3 family GTP cyclohydrolase 1 type 2